MSFEKDIDKKVYLLNNELGKKSLQARIERNRQRALLIRQKKADKRTFAHLEREMESELKETKDKKLMEGGFLKEEKNEVSKVKVKIVSNSGLFVPKSERPLCSSCKQYFIDSYLYQNFLFSICDSCKNLDEDHRLITRTEAKERYLLKDCDLDLREPPLKFILKKNPHNKRWGEMKLYLECQVAEKAGDIWGSDEKLEEEKEKRSNNKEKIKKKKFEKKIKDLRRSLTVSSYSGPSRHEHQFGEEIYEELEDSYHKICTSCGHKITYEKM